MNDQGKVLCPNCGGRGYCIDRSALPYGPLFLMGASASEAEAYHEAIHKAPRFDCTTCDKTGWVSPEAHRAVMDEVRAAL